MSLNTLKVYSRSLYTAFVERQDQFLGVFNEASQGAIQLTAAALQGDFESYAHYGVINDMVRRRNPYGDGDIPQKEIAMKEDTIVKVAAGTPEMRIDPGQWRWIQRSPEEAGAFIGLQLADQSIKDMLNTSLGCYVAATAAQADVYRDVSADPDPKAAQCSFVNLAKTAGLFGDRSNAISVWVMHSTPRTNMLVNNLNNAERLFVFGTVNVYRDAEGRTFIITDSPSLTAADDKFHICGLRPGAIQIGRNNDWDSTEVDATGKENIKRTFQAEWSYNIGLNGYAWDKATGGKAPTDAALFSAANWDRYTESHKDLGGVLLTTKEPA